MCGIIGYVGARSTTEMLLRGLRSLEYRGYDSAGLAVVRGNELELIRSEGKLENLTRQVDPKVTNGSYGLAHTRWATHGRPTEDNAHPHRDCTGTLVVVHNGIIENYLELKSRLAKEGHKLVSETDTEVIVHTIEKHFDGDLATAVRRSLDELEGLFTFVAMSVNEPDLLVGARNGPPLVLGLGEEEAFIASDVPAFLSQTRTAIFLNDGDIAIVRRGAVEIVDRTGAPQERPREQITWDPVQVEKQGFKHFMLKEICEQPQAVRDTLLGRFTLDTGPRPLERARALERLPWTHETHFHRRLRYELARRPGRKVFPGDSFADTGGSRRGVGISLPESHRRRGSSDHWDHPVRGDGRYARRIEASQGSTGHDPGDLQRHRSHGH